MGALFRTWIRSSVLRKGGSSPLWTTIGVLSLLNELRKRYAGKPDPITILSDGIRPGEVIEIRHTGKPSKAVRKERASKAALLAQFDALEQPGVRGRKAKKLRSLLSNTVVSEMHAAKTAGQYTTGTATPVLQLLESASSALHPQRALSKRGRRSAAKAARKAARRSLKTGRSAKNNGRGAA